VCVYLCVYLYVCICVFLVPPLKDFVMNRVSGDYFENLLYKLFVSIDERTTVEKLSKILDIDIQLVKVRIKGVKLLQL